MYLNISNIERLRKVSKSDPVKHGGGTKTFSTVWSPNSWSVMRFNTWTQLCVLILRNTVLLYTPWCLFKLHKSLSGCTIAIDLLYPHHPLLRSFEYAFLVNQVIYIVNEIWDSHSCLFLKKSGVWINFWYWFILLSSCTQPISFPQRDCTAVWLLTSR